MTDDQSASLSWNKAPFWGLSPDLYNCLTVAGLLMWGALSDRRMGLSFARVTVSRTENTTSNNPFNFVMGSCLAIDWILFLLEYVYRPFLLAIVARQWYYTLQYLEGRTEGKCPKGSSIF
jgi:hypothetical protein